MTSNLRVVPAAEQFTASRTRLGRVVRAGRRRTVAVAGQGSRVADDRGSVGSRATMRSRRQAVVGQAVRVRLRAGDWR